MAAALLLSGQAEREATEILREMCGRVTQREAQVLLWVMQGKTNPQVATILGASPRTISKHLERVFQTGIAIQGSGSLPCCWHAAGISS